MGIFDTLASLAGSALGLEYDIFMAPYTAGKPLDDFLDIAPETPDAATDKQVLAARRDLVVMLAAPFLLVPAIPAAYALASGKASRKGKRAADQERIGIALENASTASSTLIQTALAAPVVAAAYTYIAVQKAETGKLISKGLGDAVQTLLAVSASGPAIQGITSTISAFAKKGK